MERDSMIVSDKSAVLGSYLERFGLSALIETGLYQGHGSGMALVQASRLDRSRYVAIDQGRENTAMAAGHGFLTLLGDSARVLPTLLGLISFPVLFWLDAHYNSEHDDLSVAPHPHPLLAELDAIIHWTHGPASVVLVDDLRLLGSDGWPARADLASLDVGVVWDAAEEDDILRLTPRGRL